MQWRKPAVVWSNALRIGTHYPGQRGDFHGQEDTAGKSEGLSSDDVLDNVTLYWLTHTAVSSARLYWESKLAFFAPKGIDIPVAVSAFPDEIYTAPRSGTEAAYPKLVHYNRLAKGGHFAACEAPTVFAEELRASFRSLR